MQIRYDHTGWQSQWGTIIAQAMLPDNGEVWHRLQMTDPSGKMVTFDLSVDEARDLYLKLKVLVDKEPGGG